MMMVDDDNYEDTDISWVLYWMMVVDDRAC